MTISTKQTIAKNTIVLYIRTFFLLFISLYTSRVILHTLGVEDFGTYTAIAGVVAMLTVVMVPLANAISRFLTYEIGRGDITQIKRVFSTSKVIMYLFVILVVIILEVLGVWFLNNKMVIPSGREAVANLVLQFAILSLAFQLLQTVYSSAIIAYERMTAFAYIGILDALLKLGIAYVIVIIDYDKLASYSFLIAAEAIFLWLVYFLYCRSKLKDCFTIRLAIDRKLFVKMFGFAGWNFFGGAASTFHIQGTNILLNLFGGPVVNAAQGIANQVNNAITSFVSNFTTAINPSIIKSYAANEKEYMNSLVFQGARFSYYLVLIFVIPLEFETEYILRLWLGVVPDHAVAFVRLIILYTLVESVSKTTMTAINATGDVKMYQIVVGSLLILNLPISYVVLKIGLPVESTAIIALILSIVAVFARLFICKRIVNIDIADFFKNVLLNVAMVSFFSIILPLLMICLFQESLLRFIILLIISTVSTIICILYVGCTRTERNMILFKIESIYERFKA